MSIEAVGVVAAVVVLAGGLGTWLRVRSLQGKIARTAAELEAVRASERMAKAELDAIQHGKVAEFEAERVALQAGVDAARAEVVRAGEGAQQTRAEFDAERVRLHSEVAELKARVEAEGKRRFEEAQRLLGAHLKTLEGESERHRQFYQAEARSSVAELERRVAQADQELAGLRKYAALLDAEETMKAQLADAAALLTQVKARADAIEAEAAAAATEERTQGAAKARELRERAEAQLARATVDAARIVQEATKRAEEVGGEAFRALRDHEALEQGLKAIRNVVDGYGDRYVIPTHSFVDELAEDFGHTEAGVELKAAREHSRRMVEQELAGACDYAEANRRETAIRFVVDAFNGRVDAILSRVRSDNAGTLEQEIRDAFSLVQLNGQAFRNARVSPEYLNSRLAELKWAVVAQELRLQEREEQRRIQEQMREEDRARREYERAIEDAAKEEAALKRAMEKAREEVAHATAQDRVAMEARITDLAGRLAVAEAKSQRALSMAQQTRAGNVYVVSNLGSFGEDVYKIGMTRRREPMDRVRELGDASVPFEFDVHAMVPSDDAPALEKLLHEEFEELRINRVNYRKEFFRVPLQKIREVMERKQLKATFTMVAEAREFRESQSLANMTDVQRERFHLRRELEDTVEGE